MENQNIKNFPRYERYKDSGVDWIGEIPEHWDIHRIKQIFHERVEKNDPIKTTDILSLSMHLGVTPYSEDRGGNKAKEDLTAYHLAYPNDIVVNSMNVIVGSVGLSKYFGAVSPVYHMLYLRSQVDDIHFYDAVFQNKGFQQGLIRLGNGILIKRSESSGKLNTIRMRIPMSKLAQVFLPQPPLPEQTAIAQFLDHKTAQIDRAIAIKEEQIKLLNERKQIMIQEAVTKGLDPTVPMKDSGVEWIGEIPEHWEVRRAKYLFDEIDERSKMGTEELLSVSHMTGVTPRSEKTVHMFLAEDYSGSKICHKGDIVFNIMWAWMGALGVSYLTGIISPSYAVFREKISHTFNSKYIEFLLKSKGYIEHYNKVSTGLHSSRLRFYSRMFFAMKMGFPSYEEQNMIISNILLKSEKIDLSVNVYMNQIQALKEYKTTLINETVTGKIKVN